MSNDKTINEHTKTVQDKIDKHGVCPKCVYETNGVLKLETSTVNFNVLNTVSACASVVDTLLSLRDIRTKTNVVLDIQEPLTFSGYTADQYIDDVKQRLAVIKWKAQSKALNTALESLGGLMSEDAKTENAIAGIAAKLGL